jgi:type III restriction enzyme
MNTILKRFQLELVESANAVLSHYLHELKRVEDYPDLLDQLKAQDSALLLEAPTGTGKTIMAGNIAEKLASQGVVWFWFAPFSGITQQTESAIRTEFKGLRVRDLSQDRNADQVQSGDVYVATWALIANNSTNIHQATETLPSLEDFIRQVRRRGLHIGVVVDEAHHTFSAQNKAFEAYRNILAPDLTILVTATPNDKDIDRFLRAVGLQYLHRLSVSRERGVEARLLKRGVRVAIFRANQYAQVVDYRKTALRMAVAHHRALKEMLKNIGLTITPLLLVQVDSSEGSIAEAETWLRSMGFADSQVRKHTADEPNLELLADASDDGVEVLLFKMAVATGFDAPRAFTLCSMRATRDPDFGVQIVGRIMRVDRRLQPHLDLPEALEYGYVFLADESSQDGLLGAAKRINQMCDKYGELTSNVVVFTDIPEPYVAQVVNNQPMLFVPSACLNSPSKHFKLTYATLT